MKKKKLKGFVLPTLYVMVIGVLFVSISLLGTVLQETGDYGDLVIGAIKNNGGVTPVIKNEETPKSNIVKPYASSNVAISKSFYDMTDDATKQQNSLVYYEKTYLQNSGVLYSSDEKFEIIATYDGIVTNVGSDEILGNFIEITHNTNLKTIYYSLSETAVKKDASVKSGDVIGKSGDNLLDGEKDNCLLFEVYHNGFAIDPEDFYNLKIDELD